MKKLLFTMFYATVVLAGMGLLINGSETYAKCPIEDPGNPASYDCHIPACTAFANGLDLNEIPRPSGGTYYYGSNSMYITEEMNTSAYLCDGSYFDLGYQNGIVSVNNGIATWTCDTSSSPSSVNSVSCSAPVSTPTNTCVQGNSCTSDAQCGSGTCASNGGSYAMPGGVAASAWNSSHGAWNTMCGYEVAVPTSTPNPSGPIPAHISCAVMGQNPDPGPGMKYIVQTGYCRDTDPSLVQCGWVTTPQVCQCDPLGFPGACGNANGQTLVAAPTMPAQLCGKGNTPSPVTGVGPWSWQCTGSDNTVAQCSANIAASPTNGVCGSANNGSYSSAPTNNLCQSGTSSTVSGNGPWSWSCNGANGGSNASCSANIAPVHAMCGTANGIPTSATPSGAGLCQIGVPLPVSGPSGNPANFSWTCMGLYGGNNVSCSAPYLATTTCVDYAPTGIHAGLDTNIAPSENIKAIALNFDYNSLPDTVTTTDGGVKYIDGSSYTFTGPISATQYLKVAISNQAAGAQFIQFRDIQANGEAGKFYGCNATNWNFINPLSLLHNQQNANNGMQVDAADLNRGWIYPGNPASQFVAWNKATRGFNVNCQVCTTTTPDPYPITRNASCDAIPAHTIYNTTSTIVQTQASSGAAWLPSTNSVYNTVASTTECRFVCETGYNRNGSACVQNVTYSWDIGDWGVCSNNQQTRSVTCRDNNGNAVADSFCPSPKPSATQAASCPSTGPVCGTATTQVVHPVCYNGNFADTTPINGSSNPGFYNWNTGECGGDIYSCQIVQNSNGTRTATINHQHIAERINGMCSFLPQEQTTSYTYTETSSTQMYGSCSVGQVANWDEFEETWECIDGGLSVSCGNTPTLSCPTNLTFSTPPTQSTPGLCPVGSFVWPSSLTNQGNNYSWKCGYSSPSPSYIPSIGSWTPHVGSNPPAGNIQCYNEVGGSTESCYATCNGTLSAPLAPVNGVCGTVEQTCDAGTVASYNSTTHTWQCTGSNGGSTASCSATSNTCEAHYGEACTGTGDTLGLGGTCLGYVPGVTGTCNTNSSVSCTAASQCPDRVTPTWFPTAYTPATGSIGLSGDEVKIFNKDGGYIGICSKKVFDFYSGKVPYNVLNAEGMGSWDGDGWTNQRSAVYAIGEPSYYLFNNQNLTSQGGNTYYYTKLCRNINGAALYAAAASSSDSVYLIGPGTSNQRYIHHVNLKYNAHVYSWGNNNWAGFQSWVLKPADHPAQPATVQKSCNATTQTVGKYYCPTSPVQCASPAAIAEYVNSSSMFSASGMQGFTTFAGYRDSFIYGWGSSNSWKVFRGLNASGTDLASANISNSRNMSNIGSNVLVQRGGVSGLPSCSYVLPKPVGLSW